MKEINFCNISGINLGHYEDTTAATGCTVIITKQGAVCGVDVRGGAPGTRETDLLDPCEMIEKVHSVVLSGGSAYGLDSCSGVMKYLEEKNIGFKVGSSVVPIVSGAVIFDLEIGKSNIRPNLEMGYSACLNSENYNDNIQGNIGAGCGATVGKILGPISCMKGGFGSYAINLNGLEVGACVVVNAMGDIVCPETGEVIAGPVKDSKILNTEEIMINSFNLENTFKGNTTIACVATNANLTKAQCKKISSMSHNAYARSIFPCHTMFDGDTIFTLSTGNINADINLIGVLARKCLEKAIIKGVKSANMLHNVPSCNEIKNISFPGK